MGVGCHVHGRVVVFAVEKVKIIRSSNGDHVVLRMPTGVQDLFSKVEIVYVYFVSIASCFAIECCVSLGIEQWRRAAIRVGAICVCIVQVLVHNSFGLEQLPWLALLSRALKHGLLLAGAVERFEEIVVRST